jgi:hypothetical protein
VLTSAGQVTAGPPPPLDSNTFKQAYDQGQSVTRIRRGKMRGRCDGGSRGG